MTTALLDPAASHRVHVGQGEHYVTADPGVMLTTILGSCVAMCLRDPVAGIGGMNHFLLPDGVACGKDAGRRYGAYAMEILINDCLKMGGRRDRFEAKLFGGGRMFDSLQDVGRANADFAERFLRDEGIAVAGGSLRGAGGRRVQYWPVTGRALQRPVADHSPPLAAVLAARPVVAPDAGAVELF
ncbi:MAG: chemotaxis protein CheD [Phenylobacterium sp.]|uniref:chemotaxis protein CheD n=1 Tax=Brevundimonas sp. TaxID=1871086 RepID=UPI002737AAF6|nr:chemotaxis protein CheD [Brevundimonas sp.]MDP3801783.1 chemotaxis protein CheD [Brevundimonas sp.]MDZ4371306.1 chemotaxis protein CheD [Phenylobacterium sp.]